MAYFLHTFAPVCRSNSANNRHSTMLESVSEVSSMPTSRRSRMMPGHLTLDLSKVSDGGAGGPMTSRNPMVTPGRLTARSARNSARVRGSMSARLRRSMAHATPRLAAATTPVGLPGERRRGFGQGPDESDSDYEEAGEQEGAEVLAELEEQEEEEEEAPETPTMMVVTVDASMGKR